MALSWNLEAIENHKQICFIEDDDGTVRMNPVTETLIFMTMSVKLGEITAENADEFYARVRMIEHVGGAYMTRDGEDYYMTPQDVHAHIGLVCNVANETTLKFFTALRQNYFNGWKYDYRKAAADRQKVA